jgi:hypothetical protein
MMTVTKEADMGKKADKGPRPATSEGAGTRLGQDRLLHRADDL